MIPLSIPDLRGPIIRDLSKSIKENWVSSAGPDVIKFEKAISKFCNRKYAISTSSGSAALVLALYSIGIKRGDKVIVPDYTFAATANAVVLLGAEPIFVDVSNKTWTIDPNLVEIAIKKYKPKAVIGVNTLGLPFDVKELNFLCKKYKVILLEDAAGSLGARYERIKSGSFSEIGTFSFNGNKVLTTGSGGMLLTDNKVFAKKAKEYINQFREKNLYNYKGIGFNFRMANINAVIGLTQIKYLNKMLERKKQIAQKYDSLFDFQSEIQIMPKRVASYSSYWLYSVRLSSKMKAYNFIKYLNKNNIESRLFWRSLSIQNAYSNYPKILNGIAKKLSDTVVSLPSSSCLTLNQLKIVIKAIKKWNRKG